MSNTLPTDGIKIVPQWVIDEVKFRQLAHEDENILGILKVGKRHIGRRLVRQMQEAADSSFEIVNNSKSNKK